MNNPKTRACPKCGSLRLSQERRPDGYTICTDCQHKFRFNLSIEGAPTKEITVECPRCGQYSQSIVVSFNERTQQLDLSCVCGQEWSIPVHKNMAPEPPEVDVDIEQMTGLICINVRRINTSGPQTSKTGIRIKLPESMLVPIAEAAPYPSITLGDKDADSKIKNS